MILYEKCLLYEIFHVLMIQYDKSPEDGPNTEFSQEKATLFPSHPSALPDTDSALG